MAPNATMMASSSTDNTLERISLSPVGKSFTEVRFRHLTTVFGLMP
jgi:hypothetical protein